MHNKIKILSTVLFAMVATVIYWYVPSVQDREGTFTEREEEGSVKQRIMARTQQEIDMTKDPNLGYVPYGRLTEARNYAQALIAKYQNQYPGKTALAGINWTSRGPINVGGRTRAILFDPNDGTAKRVFAGGVSGGLWKNEDITSDTSSWSVIDDFLPNLTISSLVYDPTNTKLFYAGTGEAYAEVTPGQGVFISTDAGSTWTQMANSSMFRYISELKIRVESGVPVLYVASKRKYVGRRLKGVTTYLGVSGLYRTADGGSTWTQVLPNNADGAGNFPAVDDIEIDANGNLWASTGANSHNEKGGDIYTCSTGCDYPLNWIKKFDAIASGYTNIDRTVFAVAPSDANYIYAVGGVDLVGKEDIGFFIKSTDGGNNWSSLTIPINYEISNCSTVPTQYFTNGQATYDLVMTVHPTDRDYVLLGGIDIYRTLDGFSNTTHIGSWYAGPAPCDRAIHADQHAIVFRPGFPNEVVFGNDGGAYYSADAGNTAVTAPSFSHRVQGYNVSQCYAADISPEAGADEFIAGLQDNGTQEWDAANGAVTSEAYGGDGMICHIDQDEPLIQIAAYTYNDFHITTDDWDTSFSVIPSARTGRLTNPSDYDDTDNILYSASDTDKLCRVTGVGATNTLADRIAIGGDALSGKQATAFRVDRNAPTTLYIGTDEGKVFRVLNADGDSLSSTDIGFGLPIGWVSSIDVEKGNSNHLLVTLSNFGLASVWESDDGGASWTSVEGNLPDIPIRWGTFSPVNSDQVFLATDLGVWSTDNLDGGSTDWGITNTGLANVRCDMIKYRESDSTLIVATYGRGIYTFTIPAISGN